MTAARTFKGLLFDLDGVLYVDSRAIAGAGDAVRRIKDRGIRCRFLTNTSTLTLASLHRKVQGFGLPIEPHEIISAPQAALRYLQRQGGGACCLLLADDVRCDFAQLRQVEIEQAEDIVLGDIGAAFTYELLNRVFRRLMQGSRLIAIHKNRYWETECGLRMDIGGFVAALEYATGREALVMGKPSPDFFRVALLDMGLEAADVAVIGDDIDSDVGGGQRAGVYGILVRTGKYRQAYVETSAVRPDCVVDSVADLPRLLESPS